MNTLFTGRHVIHLDVVPSTNSYAMELLKRGNVTEGTVVRADFQSAGRGQTGNKWESEPGKNLTFSLVIHPHFLAVEKQFYLSKITSLAVLGMLTEFLPASQYDIQIKWPNDILVNTEKIAGILIENLLRGYFVQSSVIGVGLNINQKDFSVPGRGAASLARLLGKEYDLNRSLEIFCKHFEALYLNLRNYSAFRQIDKLYLHNLFGYERKRSFRSDRKEFSGTITDVEENGFLIMRDEEGRSRKFSFKEVEFL